MSAAPKPEQKRLVFDGHLLTTLIRERRLELVLSPDIARDDWPGDMRCTRVDWDGCRVVATLEAQKWPTTGDWLELLYRVPKT